MTFDIQTEACLRGFERRSRQRPDRTRLYLVSLNFAIWAVVLIAIF